MAEPSKSIPNKPTEDEKQNAPRPATNVASEPKRPVAASERLVSLDAYRGLAMFMMASGGLELARVAKEFPDSGAWQAVKYQVQHAPWVGCSLWDLIQPSFMFMVGVAAVYSYASRRARGQTQARLAWHAFGRAVILVLLGIFLRSRHATSTNFTFEDVLTQIGLGYFFLFLLCGRSARTQWIAAGAVLAIDWLLFVVYPAPGPEFDFAAVGVPANWPHLSGLAAHWDKNSNVAAAFDTWFLNLFPRERPFLFNSGGYLTLNFLPALATMIFGLLAGGLLRGPRPAMQKFLRLLGFGVAGIVAGYLWHLSGACPLVKRIWTPSWTVFAGGATTALLAGFYLVIDVWGWRRWTLPLVVVGMNSIVMYMMAELLPDWTASTLKVHFGPTVFERVGEMYARLRDTLQGVTDQPEAIARFGECYAPFVESCATLAFMWLVCYWLYRQKIFIRI